MAKMKVTVLEGTINDGSEDYTRGDFLSIETEQAKPLIESGVLAKGEVKLDSYQPAGSASEKPQPLSAALYKSFQDAVLKLDEENEKHWTSDKKPEVAALKEFGCTMSAAERDEAWLLLNG